VLKLVALPLALQVLLAVALLVVPAAAEGEVCELPGGGTGFAMYTNSTYYICIPFIEKEDEAYGVAFFVYMPDQRTVVVELEPRESTPVTYEVRVLGSDGRELATASGELTQTTTVTTALPEPADAVVVQLYFNGRLARVFAARAFERAERVPEELVNDDPRFSKAVQVLLAVLPVAPVLGLLLRATPRAVALLAFAVSWPLTTLCLWLAGLGGVEQRAVLVATAVLMVYSVVALVVWRKG